MLVLIVAILFGESAVKKKKSSSSGPVKVFLTRPGITIQIYPATPLRNRSEDSVNDEFLASFHGDLISPGSSSESRMPAFWIQ